MAKDLPPKVNADMYFKENMFDLDIARDFLAHSLPSDVTEAVNLETLEIAPSEYLNVALKRRLADVVYTVKLKDAEDDALFVVHVEQQSKPQPFMAMRMLEMMLTIQKQIARNHKLTKKTTEILSS